MHWREWCEAEQFGLGRLRFEQEVVLSATADVWVISDADGIDRLTREYAIDAEHPIIRRWSLAWDRLAERCSGVIIAPYVHESRFSDASPWYYTWDCASGCIWDASAIAEVLPSTRTGVEATA